MHKIADFAFRDIIVKFVQMIIIFDSTTGKETPHSLKYAFSPLQIKNEKDNKIHNNIQPCYGLIILQIYFLVLFIYALDDMV